MASFTNKILNQVLSGLSDRQQEVISGRFGLGKTDKVETLDAIGKRFGVTRERIRQIEAFALSSIGEEVRKHSGAQAVLNEGKKKLQEVGGVAPKAMLVSHLGRNFDDFKENHMEVLLASSGAFYSHNGDNELVPFYYLDKAALKKATNFISQWAQYLNSKKEAVLQGNYMVEFKRFLKDKKVDAVHADHHLKISSCIVKNPYGDVGLSEWPEINPKTVRDRIYLVLKKKGAPLHFESIAKGINDVGFGSRTALSTTVHNELLKDQRFVLVGRGTYGLKESGYEPGTAKEVIHRILKKNGPLKPNQVVDAVRKERIFKENTILVNLQNKSLFARLADGTYHVREA